jgi:hypothetical protein
MTRSATIAALGVHSRRVRGEIIRAGALSDDIRRLAAANEAAALLALMQQLLAALERDAA